VRELMSSVAVFEAVILAKSMCMTKSCLKTRKKKKLWQTDKYLLLLGMK